MHPYHHQHLMHPITIETTIALALRALNLGMEGGSKDVLNFGGSSDHHLGM
jgi:hypothetical protein